MEEWTSNPALRIHMEAVAVGMGAYARRLAPDDVDRWIVAGLLHDFDYEQHPSESEHPFVGVEHLRGLGVDEEILEAILGHADYSGTPRRTPMAKTLYGVDELCGFLVACVKVRPDGIESLGAKSVKKKLKDKSFAAAVNRDDIRIGCEELGVELGEHIEFLIAALREDAERLGLSKR